MYSYSISKLVIQWIVINNWCYICPFIVTPLKMAAKHQVICDKPTELFRCVKLFEVEESSTIAGGETPLHAWGEGWGL